MTECEQRVHIGTSVLAKKAEGVTLLENLAQD